MATEEDKEAHYSTEEHSYHSSDDSDYCVESDCFDDTESEEDQDDGDENGLCAICWEHTTNLVVLPCCCGSSNETMSSTRFCEECMLTCFKFGLELSSRTTGSKKLVRECPRCGQLIAIRVHMDERPIAISKATFQQSI
eukprot:scaffold15821_cov56-Attheya_sp.AAC.6